MTIHTSGLLTLTPTDFKIIHRNVELGIKIIDWGSGVPVISIVEKVGTLYESKQILFEFDDVNLPEVIVKAAGGTVPWIKTVLLPKINAALKARFLPVSSTTPINVPGSLADIDSQLGTVLKWVPMTDGTLTVAIK
jgi:hypothetical protein